MEPRLRYPLEQPPDAVVSSERRQRLLSWAIPLRAGAAAVEIRGTTDWVPTEATGLPRSGAQEGAAGDVPLVALLGVGLGLVVLVAGAVGLRVRARSAA